MFFVTGQSKSLADTTSDDPEDYEDNDDSYDDEKPKVIVLTQSQTFYIHPGDNVIFPCEAQNTGKFTLN